MAHNLQIENGGDDSTGELENPISRSIEDPVDHHIGVTEASSEIGTHDTTIKESGNHETIVTRHKNGGTNGRATGPTGFAATTACGQGRFLHNKSDGSSSSSEDDMKGGRRNKKGLKEKKSMMNIIKDKMSCHNSGAVDVVCTNNHTLSPVDTIPHEKKGNMDEIKEKLPGHHEIDS